METPIKPILLLADSQLLFWRQGETLFLDRIRALLEPERPKAAYVGASNGDQPEYFQLFEGAMAGIGVTECRMIPSEPSAADLEFFDAADLILLAGGDPHRGWRTMRKNGLQQKVIERYYTGAVLVGVSAGAVQLGLHGFKEGDESRLFETFKLVPYLIDVHSEPEWERLRRLLPQAEDARGLGIPSGGGALVQPDLTVEPIRHPLNELHVTDDGVELALIFPPGPDDEEDPAVDAEPPPEPSSESEAVH